MSASPPIATAKADSRNGPCPHYTQKRTCAVQQRMSAKGQKRTSWLVPKRVWRPDGSSVYVILHCTGTNMRRWQFIVLLGAGVMSHWEWALPSIDLKDKRATKMKRQLVSDAERQSLPIGNR